MATTQMNPEVKAEWVEALRSGRFEQGKVYLSCDGKYCCLGVLCEIAVEHGVIPQPGTYLNSDDKATKEYGPDGVLVKEASTLPAAVQDWAGIDAWGSFDGHSLTELNDNGVPFDRIANVIEEMF